MSYPAPEPQPPQQPGGPPPVWTEQSQPPPQPMGHGQVSSAPPWPVAEEGPHDFTPTKERPTFRVHAETYLGKIEIPTGLMLKYSARMAALSKKGDDITEEEDLLETLSMFRMMLLRESADRLIGHFHMVPDGATDDEMERIAQEAEDDPNAVGFETFMKLLPWMMEQYGMAPTLPSSESPDGSPQNPDDGSSLTATSSAVGPTSSPSPSTEHST